METSIEQHKESLKRHGLLYSLGELLLVFLPAFLFMEIMNDWVGQDPIRSQGTIWIANVMMLTMVWTSLKLRGESWSHLGLSIRSFHYKEGLKTVGRSLVVLLIALAGYMIGTLIIVNISGMPESADLSKYDFLKDNLGMLFLTLGGVYIVSSFGEEVIYRGFLIRRFSQLGISSQYATAIAVILSSFIFGLIHYEWGIVGMVQTGGMGLALGICFIRLKRRLWILILAHAYMDTILMVQMYLASQ